MQLFNRKDKPIQVNEQTSGATIDARYLESFNQPVKNATKEIRLFEIYIFGNREYYKSIILTDEEFKHILSLLSHNQTQNVNVDVELNKIIETDGVAKPTQIEASKKKKLVWHDIQVTNEIVMRVQEKVQSLNDEKKKTGQERTAFELEFSKREIFLMYFVLDMAYLVDLMNPKIKDGDRGKKEYELQVKRNNVTYSARMKLSVFFNPNLPFNGGDNDNGY